MKPLPIGVSDFVALRQGGYLYADKTRFIYDLVQGQKTYFLSRPPRFGKTLLVSSLQAVLTGQRELFAGLWIDSSDYDWRPVPVIRLSLENIQVVNEEIFNLELLARLQSVAASEGLTIAEATPARYFAALIKNLYQERGQRPVAILVDEYNLGIPYVKPENPRHRPMELLNAFYEVLAETEPYRGLTFLTGLPKLGESSFFSQLNNLVDLTFQPEAADICGFTQKEFDELFSDRLADTLAGVKGLGGWPAKATPAELKAEIAAFYGGFSWNAQSRLFNPWSTLNFFAKKVFASFWGNFYASLACAVLDERYLFKGFSLVTNYCFYTSMIDESANVVAVGALNAMAVSFQTGFLTVDEVNPYPEKKTFSLGPPNLETIAALYSAAFCFRKKVLDPVELRIRANWVVDALRRADETEFEAAARQFFAFIPANKYTENGEFYFLAFSLALIMAGVRVGTLDSKENEFMDFKFDLGDRETCLMKMSHVNLSEGSGKLSLKSNGAKLAFKIKDPEAIKRSLDREALKDRLWFDRVYPADKLKRLGVRKSKIILVVGDRINLRASIEKAD
ncbi:MAG: AAA family ATPase [Deltaproteobacteria bacterium]|jgi:hypothetical protein|nr:AAA family ATPase [Deltaproteobacteria bacterium]